MFLIAGNKSAAFVTLEHACSNVRVKSRNDPLMSLGCDLSVIIYHLSAATYFNPTFVYTKASDLNQRRIPAKGQ